VVGKKKPLLLLRGKELNHYPFLELSLEDITVERRKQRRQKKQKTPAIEHDDALTAIELRELTEEKDVEMCQLDMYEAYFLLYALNVLEIKTVNQVKNLYIERPQCQFIKCQKSANKV
jgi:tRNA-splicing endonuclease subunit Sen2